MGHALRYVRDAAAELSFNAGYAVDEVSFSGRHAYFNGGYAFTESDFDAGYVPFDPQEEEEYAKYSANRYDKFKIHGHCPVLPCSNAPFG